MATHIPVALNRCVELLSVSISKSNSPVAVDATLGLGGHSALLLSTFPNLKLIAIDRDPTAIEIAKERLAKFESRITYVNKTYDLIDEAIAQLNLPAVNAILFDLGVSSMQLDQAQRGFSYSQTAPLDMRMNPQHGQSAAALLSKVTETKLAALLKENADEPRAVRLARAIMQTQQRTPIESTRALADVVRDALDQTDCDEDEIVLSIRRVFQALRIAVNDEFGALDSLLSQIPHCLRPGGRVAILTFHSGEDRRVKQAFKAGLAAGVYSSVTDTVIRATPEEQHSNPRSAPAKLRFAVR